MKVLVVTNMYPTAEKPVWGIFVKEQVESLRREFPREVDIDVYLVNGARSRWAYVRSMLEVPRIVKAGGYDLVHVHYGLTQLATMLVSIPLVVTFHGTDLLRKPGYYISRVLTGKAARAIVVSGNLREQLGRGEVIPCGINVRDFRVPLTWLPGEHTLRTPRTLRLLFPGDPAVAVKNYRLFQSVCQLLTERGVAVIETHLAGVIRSEVPELFWKSDVMVLTSHREASPMVIKEAIAARLPFVSVPVGDVKEWADQVTFGMVVADRDAEMLAEAVLVMVAQGSDRRYLDSGGVERQFDHATVASQIMSIYRETVLL